MICLARRRCDVSYAMLKNKNYYSNSLSRSSLTEAQGHPRIEGDCGMPVRAGPVRRNIRGPTRRMTGVASGAATPTGRSPPRWDCP